MTWRKWLLVGIGAVVLIAAALVVVNLRVAPSPTGYSGVDTNVAYYPACGNETLEHNGRTWFQISRDDWATPSAQAAWPSGGRGLGMSVPMVAAPGPGDDTGTLYVYPEGRAYWVSDSGELDTWLTLVPQAYGWVC
jgi:hypothetical protein